jgi:hypothetical protein
VVTAKVKVTSKVDSGEGDQRQTVVTFYADYEDERNKEWSLYTPALSLSMTLKGDVADRFNHGDCFTLQFVKEEADGNQAS